MQRDNTAILDIAQAARLILEFKKGVDKAAFLDIVDLEEVWKTVTTEVPALLPLLEPLLPQQGDSH